MTEVVIFQFGEKLTALHPITLVSVQLHDSTRDLTGNADHHLCLNRTVAIDLGGKVALLNLYDLNLQRGKKGHLEHYAASDKNGGPD